MIIILRKLAVIIITIVIAAFAICVWTIGVIPASNNTVFVENVKIRIEEMFEIRNNAILDNDTAQLELLYKKDVKLGVWAFEHALKKKEYLRKWSDKQGVKFSNIKSKVYKIKVKQRKIGYRINLTVSTEYKYYYIDDKNLEMENIFRIGTYHSMDIEEADDKWVITREWYTDPFADSLKLDKIKSNEITEYILNREKTYRTVSKRQQAAIDYADRYCGAAAEEKYGLGYNKKYRNYNALGGDCANFASQILYEGGNFKKTYSWNYNKDGSKAWVNAQAFKNYMIYSGRASQIAFGSYEKVYKAAFNLQPGDFVAYQKKGKITHISMVTGWDSRGYPLVNSHNTDRFRVPWDLGWSNRGIKFWLIHVHF